MTKIGDLYTATSPPIWKYSFTQRSLWTVSVYYHDNDVNEYVCVLYNDNRKATVVWGIGDSVKDAIECAQAFWTLMSVIAQQDEKNSPFYIALKHLNEGES